MRHQDRWPAIIGDPKIVTEVWAQTDGFAYMFAWQMLESFQAYSSGLPANFRPSAFWELFNRQHEILQDSAPASMYVPSWAGY